MIIHISIFNAMIKCSWDTLLETILQSREHFTIVFIILFSYFGLLVSTCMIHHLFFTCSGKSFWRGLIVIMLFIFCTAAFISVSLIISSLFTVSLSIFPNCPLLLIPFLSSSITMLLTLILFFVVFFQIRFIESSSKSAFLQCFIKLVAFAPSTSFLKTFISGCFQN